MSIYLDAAATVKVMPEVIEVMMPYFTEEWYNPSALYSKAREIKEDIEFARKVVGDFINADSKEIYFTSSGSESNCWAIQGFVNYCYSQRKTPAIITSNIEHKSIISCVNDMDAKVRYISVDKEGFINTEMLANTLECMSDEGCSILVSIQSANNEIGTIQRIKKITDLTHRYNALFHTDAVQAFGQIFIDVKALDVDMLTISGHKIGTPKGIGVLYKKKSVQINPLIYGTQMDEMRGGTENVPYIIGMARAVQLCEASAKTRISSLRDARDYMILQLKEKFNCKVNGSEDHRLCNNINVTFPHNLTGEALIYMLDMSEIYIAAGSACNSQSVQPSYVLKAIGLTDEEALRTIRISLPGDISRDSIEKTISELEKQIKVLTM